MCYRVWANKFEGALVKYVIVQLSVVLNRSVVNVFVVSRT